MTAPEVRLPDLFERQVERTPDAEAAVAGSDRIRYRELNERANRLAHHLRNLGAGPESMVGIFLEPGIDAVVSLWAVLKAGAAYVPLDVRFPASRIEAALAAAHAEVVITSSDLRASLPPGAANVLALDEAADELAAQPAANPERSLRPQNAALVIFTSGSTGKPKGVVLVHEGLVNAYRFWEDEFELRRGVDSHCAVTSFAFAVFHADVVRAHCSGGKLVLCTADTVTSPRRLHRLLRDEEVRYVEFVPAIVRNLLDWVEERGESMPDLRIAVVSSDRWYVREHRRLRRLCGPGTRCLQSFGATETSIDTARFEGSLHGLADHELTPIGVPFPNVAVELVDEELRPVPAGEVGEMLTGGAGVTRGYLGDPALTASRFVPDPFAREPGRRAYRSGDLARLLPDGSLQFVGRADDQQKVRGFRVELGEVEAALAGHEGVRRAVATLRGLDSEHPSLVGYFVAADPTRPPRPRELRQFVAERLPDYMVPTAFVAIEAVPHTPTGKVDRGALPDPPARDGGLPELVAPRTATEGVVASIWADVLDVTPIGVNDDFFELGGQSMSAAQMLSRLESAFAISLSLGDAFEHRTVAQLAALVDDPARRDGDGDRPALEAVPRDRLLPASFAQSRFWFLDQLQPGNTAYNVTFFVTFRGRCSPPAVERAVAEIVVRHEALRTTFVASDAGLLQSIAPSVAVPVRGFDFSRRADPLAGFRRVVAHEARTSFDLERGPLLRVSLVRIALDLHVAVVALHHVVADGWSLNVLERELRTLHDAYADGRESPLEPLPVQYADYALWQRQWVEGPVLERQLAYWTERLSGAPALTDLPADRPRPKVQSGRGETWFTRLPAELAAELDALARAEGATRFMVVLAGFLALVHRLSGASDLVVGTPMANRRHPDAELLIGSFANTIALRVDLAGRPTFRELLARVRAEVLEADRNQDVPFEQVVEVVKPDRTLGHHPLFQLMFALQEPAQGGEPGGGADEPVDLPAEPVVAPVQFDLAVSVQPAAAGVVVTWESSTDLFDHGTIARYARHFETLLADAAARPDATVEELDLLTPEEIRALVVDWNDTACEYDGLVHELFEDQVRRTPEAIAVVAGRESLTYAELNARANRLAHALTERGVAAEVAVGVCLERSLDLVVALLAVLKAGGFYVPLEPSFPAERIGFALADSGARLLLTQRSLEERLPTDTPPRLLVEDDVSAYPEDDPATPLDARNLVALIYTSGSTGRPKAAAIQHGNVASLTAWSPAILGPEELSGVLAVSSICFDLSLLELFSTLARGGHILLAQDALQAGTLPAASEARFLATFPSIAAELLHSGFPPGLRTLNLGGEPFPSALVDRVYAETSVERVHNMYGPTEDTTYSSYELLEPGSPRPPRIGRPVGNTRIYVLDRLLRPVPIGVTGEAYLAGAGTARGYFDRPGVTADAFRPDPFGGRGERMYRTGDLVRHCADGSLEFVGRADGQVKVRGYRIELGEVEAVLGRHPAVHEVAATVQLDAAGEKELVAYVVLHEGAEATSGELAAACRESLPRYMVPSAFVSIDELPRQANGKVDRKRLPAADRARLEGGGFVTPRSPAEEVVVGFFAELLPGARIGVTDDFFALGGHSLLATRVLARVREAFGVELSLRDFFEAPTAAGLAERIATAARAEGGAIERVRRDRPLPLSFAQERLWWLEQLHPGAALYNVTLQARLPATDPALVAAALEDVVRRHEILRTTFGTQEGTPFARIGPVRRPDLAVLDVRTTPGAWEAAARLTEAPFDLERGPLLRACLLRVSDALSLLQVTAHHIVTDGWSQGVLLEELQAALDALRGGDAPAIPPPPIQYADYAAWQRRHLTGALLERRLSFWSELLGPDPPRLELPADRPRPAVPDHRAGVQVFAVPRETAARLRELASEAGATFFMTLLAAFSAFAHRVTGQDALVLGTVTANRSRPETERLIGLFVNTLAVPVDVSGNPTFRSLLGRVRETMLGAHGHQDLPFEKLVEELTPARSLDRNPLFDVMFVLQNAVGRGLVEPPSPTNGAVLPGTAKFDVSVTVADADEPTVSWEYARALYDDATIVRFSDGLLRVLEAVAADPDARVGDLSLLSEGERDRLVGDWSTTLVEGEALPSFPEAFERQAVATPDATAIAWKDKEISFFDLRSRAARLSRFLLERGVGPEARVVVCVERSPRLVAAFLGVLGADGCYVPLDPTLPAARLEFVVEDAAAEWVLTESPLADRFPAHADRLLLLDELEAELDQLPAEPPACALCPRDLAYVIYTSGSTGTPKGAMIEHRGLANLDLALRSAFGLGAGDRLLQLSSPSFDASIFEIVCALGSGATLCMAPADEIVPGPPLERTIEALGVTAAIVTPSALAALRPEAVPTLRLVVAAAEACSFELARTWSAGRRMFNAYGPTETSVWATVAALDGRSKPPIGRPVANVRTYVLDERLEPVPVGVVGELCLGGVGVGRGYLGRPGRTAASFVPDPFSAEPGARLYRTGDLCRFLPDGSIDYVGRRDDQVKLRGFRIELGEVASVLEQHPSVRAAVARIVEETSRRKRLVAYAVPEDGTELEPDQLRGWAEERLPPYMVPSVVVELERLPLSPTGKLDRSRLPVPAAPPEAPAAGEPSVDNPIEDVVAAIWAECLGLESADRDASFFEAGGHSLLAAELLGRIETACGVHVTPATLFAAPTARGLAAAVLAAMSSPEGDSPPPLRPAVRAGAIPLSRGQARLWAASRLRAVGGSYNLSGVVDLPARCRPAVLGLALNEVVARHEALRTRFVEVDGRPSQVVAPAVRVELPVVDLRRLAPDEAEEAVREQLAELAAARFELDSAPLLAARLFRLPGGDRLAIAAHHLIADGWSVGLVFRELAAIYDALGRGLPSPLPPPALQYADWVLWQREPHPFRAAQLAYWREQLDGLPEALELPGSHGRRAVPRNRGRSLPFAVDAETTRALRTLHRREGCTLFMALLTAYATVLHRRAGTTDLAIGTDMANRVAPGSEAIVGMLINQVVLRLDLGDEPTFVDLLRRARRAVGEAYAHQSVPFEELVDELAPRCDPGRPPLVQVKLVLENTDLRPDGPAADAEDDDDATERDASQDAPAQLDLTLYVYDLGRSLRGLLVYDTDLFDDAWAEDFARDLRNAVRELVDDPSAPVSRTREAVR